jgi:predicted amidohydrolase
MSGRTFDIAVIQLTPKKGKVEGNDATLRAAFAQLAAEPPKLIVLPESALTGYFLEGATFECAKTALRARPVSLFAKIFGTV